MVELWDKWAIARRDVGAMSIVENSYVSGQ